MMFRNPYFPYLDMFIDVNLDVFYSTSTLYKLKLDQAITTTQLHLGLFSLISTLPIDLKQSMQSTTKLPLPSKYTKKWSDN